jgi:hypothetical protein
MRRRYAHGAQAAFYFTSEAVVIDLVDLKEQASSRYGLGRRAWPDRDRPMQAHGSGRSAAGGCAVCLRFEGANPAPAVEAWDEASRHLREDGSGVSPQRRGAGMPATGALQQVTPISSWPQGVSSFPGGSPSPIPIRSRGTRESPHETLHLAPGPTLDSSGSAQGELVNREEDDPVVRPAIGLYGASGVGHCRPVEIGVRDGEREAG